MRNSKKCMKNCTFSVADSIMRTLRYLCVYTIMKKE